MNTIIFYSLMATTPQNIDFIAISASIGRVFNSNFKTIYQNNISHHFGRIYAEGYANRLSHLMSRLKT